MQDWMLESSYEHMCHHSLGCRGTLFIPRLCGEESGERGPLTSSLAHSYSPRHAEEYESHIRVWLH